MGDFEDFDISELRPASEATYQNQFADDLKGIQSAIDQLISIHTNQESQKPLPYKESKYTASVNIPVLPSNLLASGSSQIEAENSPNRKRRPAPLPPAAAINNLNKEKRHNDPLLSAWTNEGYETQRTKEF